MKHIGIFSLLALALCVMGCATPILKDHTEITKPDGTRIVMDHDETGWQLAAGNRNQSTFPDGSTEQGISKEVTAGAAKDLGNTASNTLGGALAGGGAGTVVGQPLAGAALGAGVGAILDGLRGRKAPPGPGAASGPPGAPNALTALLAEWFKGYIAANPEACRLYQALGQERYFALIDAVAGGTATPEDATQIQADMEKALADN